MPASDDSLKGAFAADGERWTFAGALVFDDAMKVLGAAAALPLPSSGTIDLAGLRYADSAAIAVLLALRRRGSAEGRKVTFTSVPPMLDSLARVYGVEDILAA